MKVHDFWQGTSLWCLEVILSYINKACIKVVRAFYSVDNRAKSWAPLRFVQRLLNWAFLREKEEVDEGNEQVVNKVKEMQNYKGLVSVNAIRLCVSAS